MATTYKLTQTELAEEIASELGCSRSEAKKFLDAAFTVAASNVKQGYRVEIAGITIEPKLRPAAKARMGRNPQTGEPVKIAARKESVQVKARVSKKMKDQAPKLAKLKEMLG